MSNLGYCAPCAAANPLPFSTGLGASESGGGKKWWVIFAVVAVVLLLRKG